MNVIKHGVENVLWGCRLIILPAVAASILASLVLIVIGTAEIGAVALKVADLTRSGVGLSGCSVEAVGRIIAAVDAFLIGTVLLIFGIGLYELFVSKIDAAESNARASRVLVVNSLEDLKERLGKVIVMALVVTFFKMAIEMKIDALHLVYYALAILMVAGALFLLNARGRKGDD